MFATFNLSVGSKLNNGLIFSGQIYVLKTSAISFEGGWARHLHQMKTVRAKSPAGVRVHKVRIYMGICPERRRKSGKLLSGGSLET